MKRIFTLLFLITTFISAHSEVIRKTYQITNFNVATAGGYQTVKFDNMQLFGKAGEPGLPYYAVQLMLPPGHEAVSISFEGSDKVYLKGYYKLCPMQHSRPLSDTREPSFIIDKALYESNTVLPKTPTGNLSTHFMNGYAYALSTFTPVQYNPLEGSLSYFQTITITITTTETSKAENALLNLTSNDRVKARCLKYAQNPEKVSLYANPARSTDSYDVLIITAQNFKSQMQQMANLYKQQGLKTVITSTDDIQSQVSGADMPEKIRNYIIQQYQESGISQVILGGDVEHVAYRGFYCSVQSSNVYEDNGIPSDLYYSALDGNWNTDGDELWAEIGEDDLLPDISVGRMSFSNTFELSAMINKTNRYQNNPIAGELRNHLLAGENLYDNPETWGSDYLELLVGTQTENGYTTTGIPRAYPIQKMYDENSTWSPQDLMDAINSGRSFINHVGHANDTYSMKFYNSDITNSNFAGVDGILHNFPIVYTHGCICGAFDVDDCIAERMVSINNFASAFVGNSRYGWFNEGQTEGPSAHLHREFMDALFTDSLNRIGSAHMESKIATAPWVNAPGQWEEGALRWCFYDCNVLGDPAMALWSNEQIPIAVVYPTNIKTGSTSFEVTVTSQEIPANNLMIAAIKDDILIGKGITNQNGIANVVLDSAITVAGPANIIVSGYNCKPTTYVTQFSGNIGIADYRLPAGINVYPNPANDFITVTFDNPNTQGTVKLQNLTGKTMKEIKMPSNCLKLIIETDDIQPGFYFLHLITDQRDETIKIIIK